MSNRFVLLRCLVASWFIAVLPNVPAALRDLFAPSRLRGCFIVMAARIAIPPSSSPARTTRRNLRIFPFHYAIRNNHYSNLPPSPLSIRPAMLYAYLHQLPEKESSLDMLGFGRKQQPSSAGPQVSTRYCTDTFNGKYPHVGLYDCRDNKVWVCKPLSGQAIRTSHARLITGCENAVSTVWKDRFLCYWFYTPGAGEGQVHGQTLNWEEAHLLVRIDPHWDYDRQQLIPAQMTSQIEDNLQRQFAHGQRILDFFQECQLPYPITLHFMGQTAEDSFFVYRRLEASQ